MARSTKPLNLQIELPKQAHADQAGGSWTFQTDLVENFAWQADLFSPEELDAIIRIGEQIETAKALTGGDLGVPNENIRKSGTAWMFPNEVTNWIFERLAHASLIMNGQYFGFKLTGMEQGLQFTTYEAPGGHYEWHIDRGGQFGCRKLSLSVQLSDPDDYEGGELELWYGGEPTVIDKQRGMTVWFPSWAMHRVKPVTKGVRRSLVCWISGPSFT
jgi:PKHD-type hydroxylase